MKDTKIKDMTIYLDIIFLENTLMNYIILYATGFVQKRKMKNFKLILSSALGALYAIVSYTNIIPIYSAPFMKILLSVIMIYIAFSNENIKQIIKNLLLFYLASFVIGGCALAMLYLISPQSVSFQNGVLVGTYPMKVTLVSGIIGFLIIQCSFSLNKRQMKIKDMLCDLEIVVKGEKVKLKGYIDSGNTLKDPLSNKPVIIVEKAIMEKIIDTDNLLGGDEKLKLRLIPFKSIGKQNGMLVGIRPEYVVIKYNENIVKTKNVIIGIYDKKISKSYSALIGLEILEGGKEHENSRNVKQSV